MKSIKTLLLSLIVILSSSYSWAQQATATDQECDAIESYVVENINVSRATMRFLKDYLHVGRSKQFSCTITLDKKGRTDDIMMIDSIDYTINEAFKTTIFTMPKGIANASDERDRTATVVFRLSLEDIPTDVAREIEYFYKKSNLIKVDLEDEELKRRLPESFSAEKYQSTPGCRSELWIIHSRAVCFKLATSTFAK